LTFSDIVFSEDKESGLLSLKKKNEQRREKSIHKRRRTKKEKQDKKKLVPVAFLSCFRLFGGTSLLLRQEATRWCVWMNARRQKTKPRKTKTLER